MNFVSEVEVSVAANKPDFKRKIYLGEIIVGFVDELTVVLTMKSSIVVQESPLELSDLAVLEQRFALSKFENTSFKMDARSIEKLKKRLLFEYCSDGCCYGLTFDKLIRL